ncbi:unnamed protein product [Rhizophagus irregularis]|nr:unnamed protein product [Rhizophagus irregularis]
MRVTFLTVKRIGKEVMSLLENFLKEYLFIPVVKRNKTLEEAYTRITVELEELTIKVKWKDQYDNYPQKTLQLFKITIIV